MKKPKLVVGHLTNDELLVKSVTTSKSFDWVKWLESEELVEFFAELFKLLPKISEGKKDAETLAIFLSEWRETALINSEPDVLADMTEAEQELNAGGGIPGHRSRRKLVCESSSVLLFELGSVKIPKVKGAELW